MNYKKLSGQECLTMAENIIKNNPWCVHWEITSIHDDGIELTAKNPMHTVGFSDIKHIASILHLTFIAKEKITLLA